MEERLGFVKFEMLYFLKITLNYCRCCGSSIVYINSLLLLCQIRLLKRSSLWYHLNVTRSMGLKYRTRCEVFIMRPICLVIKNYVCYFLKLVNCLNFLGYQEWNLTILFISFKCFNLILQDTNLFTISADGVLKTLDLHIFFIEDNLVSL